MARKEAQPPFKIRLNVMFSRETLEIGRDTGVASIILLKVQNHGLGTGKEWMRVSGAY
jgi:hypothetical protein